MIQVERNVRARKRPERRRLCGLIAALAAMSLASGCGVRPQATVYREARPRGLSNTDLTDVRLMAVDFEDEDEAEQDNRDDDNEQFDEYQDTPQKSPAGGGRKSGAAGQEDVDETSSSGSIISSVGVRGGATVPLDDRGFSPESRPTVGVFARGFETDFSAIELALDFTPDGDDIGTNFLSMARANFLLRPTVWPVYGTLGAGLLFERFSNPDTGRSETFSSPTFEIGLGIGGALSSGMAWDARVSVHFLTDSENVDKLLTIMGGVNF